MMINAVLFQPFFFSAGRGQVRLLQRERRGRREVPHSRSCRCEVSRGVLTLPARSASYTSFRSLSPSAMSQQAGWSEFGFPSGPTARAGNRRFRRLSAPRAHTKTPYKMDFIGKR